MASIDSSRYAALGVQFDPHDSHGLFYDRETGDCVLVIDGTVVQRWASPTGEIDDATWGVTGDLTISDAGVAAIGAAKVTPAMLAKPRVRCVTETLLASSLTDGTLAVGTKTLAATIPAGARFLASTCSALVGFTGDVSAIVTLGDGTDVDRYNTGTPSLFTTAAAGVDLGAPSGTAFHSAAKAVVATVTSAADITPVIAAAGSVALQFWFLEPI